MSVLSDRVAASAKVMKVKPEQVWVCLDLLGIQDDDDSLSVLEADTTTLTDGASAFCEKAPVGASPIPMPRFKLGWAILKGKSQAEPEKSSDVADLIHSIKPIASWSDEELVKSYGENASGEVTSELEKRAKNRRFVIFKSNSNDVNVDATVDMLRTARRHDTPSTYWVAGDVCRVYCVGEFPMTFVEECALHSESILVNGYCEVCGFKWDGVSEEERAMIRVGVNAGLMKIFLLEEWKKGARHPKIKLLYDELKAEGKLPILKKRLSRGGGSDPFYVHKQH